MKKFAFILALALVSCVKTGVINEIKEIDTTGTDPMSFTNAGIVQQGSPATKAQSSLNSGFMVNCWKYFADAAKQQTVMDAFVVEYKLIGNDWDGTTRALWNYKGVNGQSEKYWDYSAFPYRFHAVAPCPQLPATGFEFSEHQLTIPAPYFGQTCKDGTVSPQGAEPYLVAQVARGTDGKDLDVFTGKNINNSSTARNREVALPFHHLNSMIRFGVYCKGAWATANPLYIQGLKIDVVSKDFVTRAAGYSADGTWHIEAGNAGFYGLNKALDNLTLLQFDGGKEVKDNDLSQHQGKTSAFWLQCPGGLAQIPQQEVQMNVSLKLMKMDGTQYKEFTDVPIRLEDSPGTNLSWISGYMHTYYLILELNDKLEISFTCTLAPWEDVTGSLNTDLED